MTTDNAAIVFILGTVILVLFALFLIFFLVVHKQRQYRFLIEKQQLEHQYQNQLLQSQIEVQEQAFQYFAGEIHDNVGQILSLTKLYLYKIAKNTTGTPTEEDARQGSELLTKAIADLRNISHTASGNYISNNDIAESIQKEMEYISSAKKITCNFKKEGEPYPLEKEKNLLAFRIIQESVANALKHANPTQLDISLHYQPNALSVCIKDNGEGFDTEVLDKSGRGIGLDNMTVRANLLKGTLDIQSEKNRGTTITLDIPV